MKPPALVGVALAAIILAGMAFSPALRSAQSKQADSAAEAAELARRYVSDAGFRWLRITQFADGSKITDGDLDHLMAQSKGLFDQLDKELRDAENDAKRRDLDLNQQPSLVPLGSGKTAVTRALEQMSALMSGEDSVLAAAEKAAREAVAQGGEMVGPNQVLGLVLYLKAAQAFVRSQDFRRQLTDEYARLVAVSGDIKMTQINVDRFSGVEVAPIKADLQQKVDEMQSIADQAAADVAQGEPDVALRKAELAATESDLAAEQRKMFELEGRGFRAGDDDSFNAYRANYQRLAERIRLIESKKDFLALGGKLAGGASVSLAELEWRLQQSREKLKNANDGVAALRDRITLVDQTAEAAEGARTDYSGQIAQLSAKFDEIADRIRSLRGQAVRGESEALQFARAAAIQFRSAQNALNAWKNAAATLRRERDEKGLNLRLKLISDDVFADRVGASAEAEAKLLVGQIHAQRLRSIAEKLAAFERVALLRPGVTPRDTSEDRSAQNTSRTEAITALSEARDAFERMANGRPAVVAWIPRSALATTYYLLSIVDPSNRDANFAAALENIEQAVAGRERSPYVMPHLALRDHLKRLAAGGMKPEDEFDQDEGF